MSKRPLVISTQAQQFVLDQRKETIYTSEISDYTTTRTNLTPSTRKIFLYTHLVGSISIIC